MQSAKPLMNFIVEVLTLFYACKMYNFAFYMTTKTTLYLFIDTYMQAYMVRRTCFSEISNKLLGLLSE